jgi:hypothetical protein
VEGVLSETMGGLDHYAHWETCMALIGKGKPEEAARRALQSALALGVPKALADRIGAVNLAGFEKKIDGRMRECIARAKAENAEALCLYYSLDNGWDSTIYICKHYSDTRNDWITASRSWIEIGKARGFSGIYKKEAHSAFFCDALSAGICILLMSRTTLAFYAVAQKYRDCGLKLCVTCTESDFVRVV